MNLLGLTEAAATVFRAFGTDRPAESGWDVVAGVRVLRFCMAVPGVLPSACNKLGTMLYRRQKSQNSSVTLLLGGICPHAMVTIAYQQQAKAHSCTCCGSAIAAAVCIEEAAATICLKG